MPEPVKDAVLTRDQVGQEHFSNFVKERIVERKLSVWSPMKKVNLQTWKTTRATKKSKTAYSVAALKDDRALFARFLVVVLSRPEIDLKKCISEFELATFPRALFNSDGDLSQCVGKSKLGKPTWVRTGRDLASHFLEIIDNRSKELDEVHVIFDRYDLPNSLKESTRQFRQGSNRPMLYQISDEAVIEKIAVMSTRNRWPSILHLISSSVTKTPLRPML